LSLVGQDAVNFNRAFGRCGLARDTFRLSCAIEENGLLAMGADNTDGLFVSSGYFGSLDNDGNMGFKERYHNHFGERAPTLNSLGQSTYEGMHFMAALARRAADDDAQLLGPLSAPLAYRSVRGTRYFDNEACSQPTFLAEAQGHFFQPPIAL
jgi:urea transport system substrate-binding protein